MRKIDKELIQHIEELDIINIKKDFSKGANINLIYKNITLFDYIIKLIGEIEEDIFIVNDLLDNIQEDDIDEGQNIDDVIISLEDRQEDLQFELEDYKDIETLLYNQLYKLNFSDTLKLIKLSPYLRKLQIKIKNDINYRPFGKEWSKLAEKYRNIEMVKEDKYSFGKKRKVNNKISKKLKIKAKKYNIRLTVTKNGKYIKKSKIKLEKQIKLHK